MRVLNLTFIYIKREDLNVPPIYKAYIKREDLNVPLIYKANMKREVFRFSQFKRYI